MAKTSDKPFRVILVGGGLVSLTAAHILSKADIDFVILEKHDRLLTQIGSLLGLIPSTLRIFDQLGILDDVTAIACPVVSNYVMSADDQTLFSNLESGKHFRTFHGRDSLVTHRPFLIDVLYKTLPPSAKARVKVGKLVTSISTTSSPDGVRVECADGTVEEGSMVIGADGVYSKTRQIMEALASGSSAAPSASEEPEAPYVSTYRFLFGNIPMPPGVTAGVNYECASDGVSTQLMAGTDRAWLGVYEALDQPTPGNLRYTDADKEALLKKYSHLYVAPGWTVADAFALREGEMGLVPLQEGWVERWWHARIVLVGDAVRKLDPHAGLGYNSGVMDMVVLANKLRRLLLADPCPDTEALGAVFADYQAQMALYKPNTDYLSRVRPRQLGWLTAKDKLMTKYVIPWTGLNKLGVRYVLAPFISSLPVLEWLEEKGPPGKPRLPYVHHALVEGKGVVVPQRSSQSLSLFTGAFAVAAIAAAGLQYYGRIL